MANDVKGTVTSLASLYRAEEARKAAKMVEQKISENQNELQSLNLFLSDNANLMKLVQKLPDELFHNVMVPFGKAAFFPGRLIHTNEFLVLLGEGYYTERTSKQTVEILQRRGKSLESQIDSLNAMMEDLKAEASFFLNTANEAAEGVVEIREDYIEEIPSKMFSDQAAVSKVDAAGTSKDAGIRGDGNEEEYARMMAKLDELEREELAAENVEGDEEQHFDQSLKIQELEDSNIMQVVKEKTLHGNVALNMEKCEIVEKPARHPELKEKGFAAMPNTAEVESKKDIIGSIVEHSTPISETGPTIQSAVPSQPTSSKPAKPVSRFKMQRAGR